ncbi:MAG: Abi-like protein, partial [Bacteroidales bacterium]|nr:Abi-like protein [Bacteroidales bacterium]
MEQYAKPPLKYTEQVNLLKSRGLIFADEQGAEKQLANISYYRLSAYMLPYKKKDENDVIID